MSARYFQFTTNAKGMVILSGLSPDETFELEHLLHQNDDLRSVPDRIRLDALCEKHCNAAKTATPPDIVGASDARSRRMGRALAKPILSRLGR